MPKTYPELPRLSAHAPIAELEAALDEFGAVIAEGVLDPDLLERFNAELDPLLEPISAERASLDPSFNGRHTRQISGLAAQSRVFAEEVLCHPFYSTMCDAVLGPNCSGYQLNLAQIMDRGPGAGQQVLHFDDYVWPHLPWPRPEVELASVIALVDFHEGNGATILAPGSHRWERERQPEPSELVCAEMPAGSAVVYLGSTIHGGGPNTTDGWRRAMHLSFVVGWLRTEENLYLSTPLEIARTLPRRSQELLGYTVHGLPGEGFLGKVDMANPAELMAAGRL